MGWIIGITIVIFLIYKIKKFFKIARLEEEIRHLALFKRDCVVLPKIKYKLAREFAIKNGAKIEKDSDYCIMCETQLDGTNYYVYFSRMQNGSTYLGINNADKLDQQFKDKIEGKISKITF